MKKSLKAVTFSSIGLLAITVGSILASCDNRPEIIIWGAGDHEDLYREYAQQYAEENQWDVRFTVAGQGDSGAYSAMSTDVTKGAAVFTYANDMLVNLNRIGALAPLRGDNLTWAQENHVEVALETGKLGDTYYGYPVSADNGFFMFYNQDAFEGTDVWDATTNDLKEGYTFLDLYKALDQKGGDWADAKVTWAMGDAWYISGVFFGAGGDYEIIYDDEGNIESSDCWFAYEVDEEGKEDYTIGYRASEMMKNTIMQDGKVSSHYLYSDASSTHLNDNITAGIPSIDANGNVTQPTKFKVAAAISGTWKTKEIKKAWGDDARATVLPALEDDEGNKYDFYSFSGYKLMGVNPMCSYARESAENLQRLHDFAKYLTDVEVSLARYNATGLGPSNIEARKDKAVAEDFGLAALTEQYAIANHVQSSVPANYWTPIQNFGAGMYTDLLAGGTKYTQKASLAKELKQMQLQIEGAVQ